MRSRRLPAPSPEGKALWVPLDVQPIGDQWAAMIIADDAIQCKLGTVKGLAFFAAAQEEAEQTAKV